MNWSAALVALVPPPAVTVTSTVPVPAGSVAVIRVELFTVKFVAAVAPKRTVFAPRNPLPVNPVPVMETWSPPVFTP